MFFFKLVQNSPYLWTLPNMNNWSTHSTECTSHRFCKDYSHRYRQPNNLDSYLDILAYRHTRTCCQTRHSRPGGGTCSGRTESGGLPPRTAGRQSPGGSDTRNLRRCRYTGHGLGRAATCTRSGSEIKSIRKNIALKKIRRQNFPRSWSIQSDRASLKNYTMWFMINFDCLCLYERMRLFFYHAYDNFKTSPKVQTIQSIK